MLEILENKSENKKTLPASGARILEMRIVASRREKLYILKCNCDFVISAANVNDPIKKLLNYPDNPINIAPNSRIGSNSSGLIIDTNVARPTNINPPHNGINKVNFRPYLSANVPYIPVKNIAGMA